MDRQHSTEKNAYSKYSHSEEADRADLPPAESCKKIQETDKIAEFLGNILGNGKDPDKFLIIALIFLLIREGADTKLIIALGYILL